MIRAYADAIVESVREGLVVLDEDLRIQFANAAFRGMFPARTIAPGLLWMEVAEPALDAPEFRLRLQDLVESRQSIDDFELAIDSSAGSSRTLLISARVLGDRAAASPTFLLVLEDITLRRVAEKALASRSAELARSNDDLEQFAAAASHDLREPLRKIQAFGSRLAARYGSVLDQQGVEYVDRMVESSARLQNLISDQLQYARIAVRTPEATATSLREIVSEVLVELELRIEDTGASIQVSELPVVAVDPDLFRHVFLNLIGNALKFTRQGIRPEIHIYASMPVGSTALAVIVVEDNGIGIEARYAERIFRPFQRLHTRASYEGSGMGLAIVRRIVERHGGSVDVDSVLGKGTRFSISVPMPSAIGVDR